MKEAVFQTEFLASWKHFYPYCHAYKIPDLPKFTGDQYRFSPKRPYDCFVVEAGKFYAFELKWMKTVGAFPFDRVSDHQIAYLLEAKRAGGYGFVVINYRCHGVPEKTQKKYGISKDYNAAFIVDVEEFVRVSEHCEGKSIPFDDLTNAAIVRFRIKDGGTYWDIRDLI